MSGRRGLSRWLASTSNRTFIAWPAVLFAAEALIQQGVPRIDPYALPLLAWGYLQYRWVGNYRARLGGGGPGISIPPERLVTSGPYRIVRNPMYLGHIIFFVGLAIVLRSWIAAAVLGFHLVWFDRRARADEARLALLFGDAYRDYCRRVKRWIPGVY
ncbi:MAG TPA: isoprenylcysteine carboxylmethyltransferase family protein [Usitatibacter sp.]|nr:isoprenylcysteine carboxylmethyltransferase family protein [Usitatibacter sp.]